MKLKKLLISLSLVLMLGCSFISTAGAAEYIPPAPASSGDIVPMAEQTVWYNRVRNGIVEKRLWSITYGVWLTDWMPA